MIKFRVWNELLELYIPKEIADKLTLKELNKKGYIAEQCTGLKDKNGKDIYVGDIVALNNTKTLVNYHMEVASFVLEHDLGSYQLTTNKIVRLEVIGNIHENKEIFE